MIYSIIDLHVCKMTAIYIYKATENVRTKRRLAEEMLRNLLHENSQITIMDDLLNSINERSERSKATKLWSDTDKGIVHHDCFCSRSQ